MNVQTKTKPTTIDTKALHIALKLVKPVMKSSYRCAIPVLKMVRISASGTTGTITATDLDREMTASFPMEGETIDFLIEPRILENFLRHGGPQIEVGKGEGKYGKVIVLETGDLVGRINEICEVEDFPESMFETKKGFDKPQEIDAAALRYALDAAAVSISTEETRYYLNGVFLESIPADHKKAHILNMVSTDGHRITKVQVPNIPWKREGMILPRMAVDQLRKDLKGLDKVKIAHSENDMVLKVTNPKWSMVTKLIDGQFPDYRRVIPEVDGSFSVSLTGDALAALPNMGERSQPLKIIPEEGRMMVEAPHVGEVSMPIHGAKGVTVGINLTYLKEFCPRGEAVKLVGNCPKKEGAAGFNGNPYVTDPVIIMGADENILRCVMPMRV